MIKRCEARFIFLIFVSFLFLHAALAQEDSQIDDVGPNIDSSGNIEKAYQCLRDRVIGKDDVDISLEEAIFSILALGGENKLESVIEADKSNNNCWPKSNCKVKDTSQILLAYDRIGKETREIESWIKSREQTAKDLTWYIQIDIESHEPAECEITYDSQAKKIDIRADMTLQGNTGSCLSIGYGGFWLKINDNCIDKEFEISCEKDFATAIAYQKGNTGTIYISSETHSSSSLGKTTEKVKSVCLAGANSRCDYEGTLWSAIALQKTGNDISVYLPYLLAFAEDNKNVFPSSFLHILTSSEEQYNEIISNQKREQYWDIAGSPYNRFYDSGLALIALSGKNSLEETNAKEYLLEIQTDEGCWNNNNIRDTAFLLYSGWPRSVSIGSNPASCVNKGYSCESQFECVSSEGDILNEYDCSQFGGLQVCCSVGVQEESCSEKGGVVCTSNQECQGTSQSSSDGSCCLGSCIAVSVENECEDFGGSCRSSCFSDEIDIGYDCPLSGDVCCNVSEKEEASGLSVWIIILIILILLVILGIIFRRKLQMIIYRWRGKFKSGPVSSTRPGSPPAYPPRQMMPQRTMPQQIRRPSSQPVDREMEETMRKLKEMSA